jgi:hypothetical protein
MSILQAAAIAIVPVAVLSTVLYTGIRRLANRADSYELAA